MEAATKGNIKAIHEMNCRRSNMNNELIVKQYLVRCNTEGIDYITDEKRNLKCSFIKCRCIIRYIYGTYAAMYTRQKILRYLLHDCTCARTQFLRKMRT